VPRPTFIIAEPEPEQALSSRKLVVETAKFNVVTAHSAGEYIELLSCFPKVDAVILHTGLEGGNIEKLIASSRDIKANLPVIVLDPLARRYSGVDHTLSSHDPQELVNLLRKLFGDPRKPRGNHNS